jgi:hypothetical protein
MKLTALICKVIGHSPKSIFRDGLWRQQTCRCGLKMGWSPVCEREVRNALIESTTLLMGARQMVKTDLGRAHYDALIAHNNHLIREFGK